MTLQTKLFTGAIPVALGLLALGNAPRVFAQCPNALPLEVNVLLGGVYDPETGIMHDSLRVNGLIPLTEPYSALGYVHNGGGGGELAHPSLFAIVGPDAVVDWVVVELRHPNDPGKRIATKSALLQRSGNVIAANGQPLTFCVPQGRYQVAIRHRNHLGVITQRSTLLDGSLAEVNFRDTGAPANTRGGMEALRVMNVDSALFGLWPGDVSFDGNVRYVGMDNDRDPILTGLGGTVPTNVVSNVYVQPDVNLDSRVQYVGQHNDRDPILVAVGGSVPTNVREDFIPDDSLVFKPNVHFVDSTVWVLDLQASSLPGGSIMVFDILGAMPSVEEGHTIVMNAAGGYIRRVTSATVDGDRLTVHSVPGNFLDIFESGTFNYDAAVSGASAGLNSFGPLAFTLPSGSGVQGGLLDFNVDANYTLSASQKISLIGTSRLDLGFSGQVTLSGKLKLDGQLSSADIPFLEIPLGAVPVPITIPTPVPFIIPMLCVFSLEGNLGGSVGVSTGYELDFNVSGNVHAGLHYQSGLPAVPQFSAQYTSPQLTTISTGTGSVSFAAEVSSGLKVIGLIGGSPIGPFIELGPNHKLEKVWSAEEDQHTSFTTTLTGTIGVELVGQTDGESAVDASWETPPVLEFKSPGKLEYISGSDQSGQREEQLAEMIVARSMSTLKVLGTEVASFASEDNRIRFTPDTDCGSVLPEEGISDSDGMSSKYWTLGTGVLGSDEQTMVVSLKDGTGAHVDGSPFSVIATTASPRLDMAGGDYQQGVQNTALADGLIVRVVSNDEAQTPVPNVTVNFEVINGGGQLIGPQAVTDADGYAFAYWSLGTYAAGAQEVQASLLDGEGNHVEGSPLQFTATFSTLRVVQVSGNEQWGEAESLLDEEIRVQLVSDFGPNTDFPIVGVAMHFEVIGSGLVYPVDVISDATGHASAAWSLGSCSDGAQRVEVTVNVPPEVTVEPTPLEFTANIDPAASTGCCGAIDIDGNYYPTVEIGANCWFTEDLKVTRYNNGDTILAASGVEWNTATEGRYASGTFGNYYNRLAAFDTRGICPTGWHVSTQADWLQLLTDAGTEDGGSAAPLRGYLGWTNPLLVGNNSSGFNGRPGGIITFNGVMSFLGTHAYYMTSSMGDYGFPWTFYMSHSINSSDGIGSTQGMACRCVKD